MTMSPDFLANLSCPHPKVIFESFLKGNRPKGGELWTIYNEVKPADLFCYFGARFGPPNGVQNFLRKDDSDNLIHWDWTLLSEYGWLCVLGMNFRAEIQLLGKFPFVPDDRDELIRQLKADFSTQGKEMSKIRKEVLEKWTEFVNPYLRLKNALDDLFKEIDSLALDPTGDAVPNYVDGNIERFATNWNAISSRYSKGLGLCFGVRAMLPVMAEAFINMALFVLMRPDLKADARLREHHMRQPIDIRIRSLHINCVGFAHAVDYSNPACGNYHTLVNERNDLLHGNVSIERLRFNEVYFYGRVPVFQQCRSMWERSIGVAIEASGIDRISHERRIIDEFIEYVLSCLSPDMRQQLERILRTRDLGIEDHTGKLGILFGDYLADMHMGVPPEHDSSDSPVDL